MTLLAGIIVLSNCVLQAFADYDDHGIAEVFGRLNSFQVYRTIYEPYTKSFYKLFGIMGSGSLLTSMGNSIYQIIMCDVWIMSQVSRLRLTGKVYKYKGRVYPVWKMLLEAWNYEVIQLSDYGDDNVFSIPSLLMELAGIEVFGKENPCSYQYMCDLMGTDLRIAKECALVGTVEYESYKRNGVTLYRQVSVDKDIGFPSSVCFLHYYMKKITVDGRVIGNHPWVDNVTIAGRIGLSLKGHVDLKTFLGMLVGTSLNIGANMTYYVYISLLFVVAKSLYVQRHGFLSLEEIYLGAAEKYEYHVVNSLRDYKGGPKVPRFIELCKIQHRGFVSKYGMPEYRSCGGVVETEKMHLRRFKDRQRLAKDFGIV
jgi:hypothetical protein